MHDISEDGTVLTVNTGGVFETRVRVEAPVAECAGEFASFTYRLRLYVSEAEEEGVQSTAPEDERVMVEGLFPAIHTFFSEERVTAAPFRVTDRVPV